MLPADRLNAITVSQHSLGEKNNSQEKNAIKKIQLKNSKDASIFRTKKMGKIAKNLPLKILTRTLNTKNENN